MAPTSAPSSDPGGLWYQTLVKGHVPLKGFRRVMRLLPGSPRCKVCNNPFGGFGGRVCRVVGMTPSRKNPRLCALCCEKLPPGGAETDTAVLFADIRGSSDLSRKLGPTAYAELLNRFYETATHVLAMNNATIDKLIGDEVMAFFIPGFAGRGYRETAVECGLSLLEHLGYGSNDGPWLPVGIAVDAGNAFVGNVGGEGFVDFTVIGDPVNHAAHLQSAASPGELLVGGAAFSTIHDRYPTARRRSVVLKGRVEPEEAWVLGVA